MGEEEVSVFFLREHRASTSKPLTRGLVDGRLADASGVKHDGGANIVPLLACERIDDLFLLTLLASLRQTLVFSNGHF